MTLILLASISFFAKALLYVDKTATIVPKRKKKSRFAHLILTSRPILSELCFCMIKHNLKDIQLVGTKKWIGLCTVL